MSKVRQALKVGLEAIPCPSALSVRFGCRVGSGRFHAGWRSIGLFGSVYGLVVRRVGSAVAPGQSTGTYADETFCRPDSQSKGRVTEYLALHSDLAGIGCGFFV